VSCWGELHDPYREALMRSLETALSDERAGCVRVCVRECVCVRVPSYRGLYCGLIAACVAALLRLVLRMRLGGAPCHSHSSWRGAVQSECWSRASE
jgi:hypothetical protein